MNKFLNFPALILLSVILVFSACKKNNPEPVNEEELITTVKMTVAEEGSILGAGTTYTWKDLDGDGPEAPVLNPATLKLNPSKTYNVRLELFNESENPVKDITEEIKAEKEDHQFFFQTSGVGYNLFKSYSGVNDANSQPVGLQFVLETKTVGSGKFKVILKHKPNKGAVGVSKGDMTNAGGQTDVEAEFDVSVALPIIITKE
jgi:hypothetical protein